jgi:hypothetical protein
MAKIKSGGGITSNKFVQPNIRTGSPNKGTSPAAADQIGQSVSFKREQVEMGRAYQGTPLGNEVALNVQGGGPGKGREVFRSGSQGTHGPTVAGEPRQPGTADRGDRAILGPKGS